MTMHASKGLEFPIVALANLFCRAAQRRRSRPRPARAIGLHLRIKAGEAEFKTPGFEDAWDARASQTGASRSACSTSP